VYNSLHSFMLCSLDKILLYFRFTNYSWKVCLGVHRSVANASINKAMFARTKIVQTLCYIINLLVTFNINTSLRTANVKLYDNDVTCEISLMGFWTISFVTDHTDTTFRKQIAFVFRCIKILRNSNELKILFLYFVSVQKDIRDISHAIVKLY
jgi:hypothetical protein